MDSGNNSKDPGVFIKKPSETAITEVYIKEEPSLDCSDESETVFKQNKVDSCEKLNVKSNKDEMDVLNIKKEFPEYSANYEEMMEQLEERLKEMDEIPISKASPLSVNLERNLQRECSEPSPSEKKIDGEFSSIKKLHVCTFPGCNKRFRKNNLLLSHTRIHTGERPYTCAYKGCQKSYTRRFHLTRHVAVFHSEKFPVQESDKFRCDLCSKVFSNVYSLKKHLKKHSEGRFTCNECGSIFTTQQFLKAHSYQHTGILPYKCDYPDCEKRFIAPSRLKRHSQVHLENRFNCDFENCNANFNFHWELRKHIIGSHKKVTVCGVCGKKFKELGRLKNHLKTHDME